MPRCFLCYQLHHLVLRTLEIGAFDIFKGKKNNRILPHMLLANGLIPGNVESFKK